MKKLIAIVLAVSMLGSGCCTVAAVSNDLPWAAPVTVPVDIVLLPVEVLGLEVLARVVTEGECGAMVFIAPFGGAK
ncbi:MAG: hypothetical protein IJI73_03640 [Kiritimatiellae bacterium]|nr:hypothetical protein [Kiritimatiellia bacterium]